MSQETREERQKRIEQNSKRIQIRAMLQNIHKLPFITSEQGEKIKDGLKQFLPIIKDEVKSFFGNMSEKMGAGNDKKIYVLRNGKEGMEIWTMKNMRAFDGDKVSTFSFKRILDRIDKYQLAEALIADLITGRLFGEEDYVIDEINTADENKEGEKLLEENKQKQLQQP